MPQIKSALMMKVQHQWKREIPNGFLHKMSLVQRLRIDVQKADNRANTSNFYDCRKCVTSMEEGNS